MVGNRFLETIDEIDAMYKVTTTKKSDLYNGLIRRLNIELEGDEYTVYLVLIFKKDYINYCLMEVHTNDIFPELQSSEILLNPLEEIIVDRILNVLNEEYDD